ncbi:MAG: 4-(cytidine 5'-diphospho)-2-C-methyl-D-erythritol kinase [Acholeplasmataceae bacterium]|jgi:4-diphosphocytidyl-2-C-methyl-D-erythritol kinase|nr:4-(cytidine 5'-diphospho)-2-C-methyl-D-erythritol kinase [Acholeplasmataceae bacterium]
MIKEKAYAKINLILDVQGKRFDGYHELKMIMMPIELHDVITFEDSDVISLISNVQINQNAILKTVHLIKERFHINRGAIITLEKNIPIGAGLAGGSADIAATIRGLNQLWNLNLDINDMAKIATELGSDTLFCLYNKTAYVYGRGEHLLFINQPPIDEIFLITSDVEASTKTVFENHQLVSRKNRFNRLFKYYINEKYKKFFAKTYNDLTKTSWSVYPKLEEIAKKIKKARLPFLMTGSGSTFFILKLSHEKVDYKAKIAKMGLNFIETRPKN